MLLDVLIHIVCIIIFLQMYLEIMSQRTYSDYSIYNWLWW